MTTEPQKSPWRADFLGFINQVSSNHPTLLLLVLTAIGLFLRLHQFTSRSLWLDEKVQAEISRQPSFAEMFELQRLDFYPPGYASLLHVVVHTIGEYEWSLRLPSLVAGVGLIWIAWRLADVWFGRFAAGVFAVLVTFSPAYVFYSREARAYATGQAWLGLFLLAASAYCREPTWRRSIVLALSATVCIIWQYFFSVIVATVYLALMVHRLRASGIRRLDLLQWSTTLLPIAILQMVILWEFTMPQMTRPDGFRLHMHFSRYYYSLTNVNDAVAFWLTKPYEYLRYFLCMQLYGPRYDPIAWTVCLFSAIALIHGVRACIDRNQRGLLAIPAIPLIVMLLLAGVGLHPFGATRHTMPTTLALFALFALGVAHLHAQRRGLTNALFLLVLINGVYCQGKVSAWLQRHDARELVQDVLGQADKQAPILVINGGDAFGYYHHRAKGIQPVRQIDGPGVDTQVFRQTVAKTLTVSKEIWVVDCLVEAPAIDEILRTLARPTSTHQRIGIRAVRWERR